MSQRNAPFGPWGKTPGLSERLKELHAAPQLFSNSEMARMLSREFGIAITRNAVVGKSARLGLPYRARASRGGGSMPGARPPGSRARKIAPPPPVAVIRPKPHHLRLVDLRDSGCKYPFGDGPFTFCGAPCLEEQPYCELHYALTHVEPKARWA